MFSGNKAIAFWFAAMVMQLVVSIGVNDWVGRAAVLIGATFSAWLFMDGFMAAMRPVKQYEFKEANQSLKTGTDKPTVG